MLQPLLNLLFPPQCMNCKTFVPVNGTLCLPCWSQIRFITDPFCACCGHPFDFALGAGALCAGCMQSRPSFSRARAVFRYDAASRSLVLRLKYHDQTQLSAIYGTWLAKAGHELIAASDVIIPVPLHYRRFIARRYNQSALLAKALGKHVHLPTLLDGLKRTRATQPQAGLTRRQRQENVRGAFTVSPKRANHIKGKSVLLIDDVMTTSATLEACTKALMDAGAQTVNVLTLARKAD